jgi:hypothetical protein
MVLGRSKAAVFVVGLLLAGATGCGGSQFRYIANEQENLFFRVPKDWKIFRLTASDREGRPAAEPSSFERSWNLVVDGNPAADPIHIVDHAPVEPIVQAEVYVLRRDTNEGMSLSELRKIAYGGFDPVLYSPGAPPRWENVEGSFVDLSFPKGVTGTRQAINVPDPEAREDKTKFATLDVSAIHDVVNARVYILKIRCSSQCYLDRRAEIDDVMNSWTVNRT